MDDQKNGRGGAVLGLAAIACCGVPLLIVTGALGGVGAWLLNNGVLVIVGAVLAAAAFVYAWKRWGRAAGAAKAEEREYR